MIENRKWKETKTAVALAYEPGDVAPKILATGTGEVADRIIEKAKESKVPLYKDNKLADTLSRLKIGDAIPPELGAFGFKIAIHLGVVDMHDSLLQIAAMLVSQKAVGKFGNFMRNQGIDILLGDFGCFHIDHPLFALMNNSISS